MIYALVEPSIYMIANILPTTRHLYRRVVRNARQLRDAKSNNNNSNSTSRGGGGAAVNSSSSGGGLSQSNELERIKNSRTSSRGIVWRVDVWQTNTNSSQEELTLSEWYHNRHEWNQSKPSETSPPGTPDATGGLKTPYTNVAGA